MTARSIFSLSVFRFLISSILFEIQSYKRKLSYIALEMFRNTLTLTIDAVVSRKPVVRF